MIVTSMLQSGSPRPGHAPPRSAASRKVTFRPHPSPRSPTSSPSLLISAIFSPGRGETTHRSSSAALPLSRTWDGASGASPLLSRSPSVASGVYGSRYSARSRSAASPTRTPSAGFRSPSAGHQVPRQQHGGRSPSAQHAHQNLIPQQAGGSNVRSSPYVNRTPQAVTSYSSSAPARRRRPKTSTWVQFHSRPLGAEVYPTLQQSDLDRETALFRSRAVLLEQLLSHNSKPQSARWRSMSGSRSDGRSGRGGGGGGGGDSFCRASLAESHMNNADEARVYHVIPQRVLSARGNIGGRGVNVALQQVNQSLCHRRQLLHRSLPATSPYNNDNNNNYNYNNNSNDNNNNVENNGINSNSSSSITSISNNNVGMKDTTLADRPANHEPELLQEEKTRIPSGGLDEREPLRTSSTTLKENDVKTDPKSQSPKMAQREPRSSPKQANRDMTSPQKEDADLRSSAKTERALASAEKDVAGGRRQGLHQQRIRGVASQEHSAQWLEESQLKQEESVTILSEQLQSMIPGQEGDVSSALSPAWRESMSVLFPSVGEYSPLTLLPCAPRHKEVDEDETEGREMGGHDRAGKGGREMERTRCMKSMQCEVLGPYSCADCTKIRLHERQQQEQSSLYPDLFVDPRTLVAPDRLRRLTASLPPHLTSQRHTLDCGCAISMHPDFLFPVLVTDQTIQSRLKRTKVSPQGPRVLTEAEAASLLATEELGEEGEGEDQQGAQILVLGDDVDKEEEETSSSPVDLKVTVRYTTPSPAPEDKGVFITN